MTTNIYLVRHGEIENPKNIIYERMPGFKLTKKGEEQLAKTTLYLLDKNIDAIYSSPMKRARQSAKIIQNKIPVSNIRILYDLIEVKTPMQGRSFTELASAGDYYLPLLHPYENMEKIAERMESAIKKIIKNHKGKSVVAVSHGDPIMILKAKLENLPMEMQSIRNKSYVQHGEILLIQEKGDESLSIKSVFTPV